MPVQPQQIASQQKARIYRVGILGAGIFVHLVVCWTVLSLGYVDLQPLEFLALASLSAAGLLFIALLMGIEWNLTLEDPDMAVPQMIWALSVVVMTSHFAFELKAVLLLSGLAMIVMGANRLNRAQQILVASYGLGLCLISLILSSNAAGLGWITEIVLMVAFGLVLGIAPTLARYERSLSEGEINQKNLELGEALAQIKELAIRDELTGIFNRRHIMDILDREKALSDRERHVFSVCYVDLDFFKKVNDKFGHAAGDEVLCNFASLASEVGREVDSVARVGGEEFIMVLSGTCQEDAVIAAERLASKLRDMRVSRIEPRFRITASIGIAEYRTGESVRSLLDRADRAMYDAKQTGRNKIIIAAKEDTLISLS
ncbi:MAG: GGDEF domain-containing protein [Gammaproteobacteria bacterium]